MHTSRRQFMAAAGSSALISLSPLVPEFLLQAAAGKEVAAGEKVLVVVQLTGGNDGINTVVPHADPEYRRNRFTLAIGKNAALKIDDECGFHPSLSGFAKLLEDNRLAIVQGIGYPNPNRSHFESMDLWQSAHRKSGNRPLGWLGRYLDAAIIPDSGAVPALHLGSEKQPLALTASRLQVPSVQSMDRFRLKIDGDESLRATIESLSGQKRPQGNDLLQFIQRGTSAALTTSRRIEEALGDYKTKTNYPAGRLAEKLRTIAQLIAAGIKTRIYYVTLDGFDTHSQQGPAHAALLQQLGGAVGAFIEDLAEHGQAKRVMLMTISEFGRRVKENASGGTDHGAAAPLFLAGEGVKAGLHGKRPSMTDLVDGDLKFHTDYRRVYATVLENWLGCESEPILGGIYQPLKIITG